MMLIPKKYNEITSFYGLTRVHKKMKDAKRWIYHPQIQYFFAFVKFLIYLSALGTL